MSWLRPFFNWIATFFLQLYEVGKAFVIWIWGFFWGIIGPFVEAMIDMMNQALGYIGYGELGPLRDAWATADLWFPVTELLVLLGIYYTYWAVVIAVRWLIHMIPLIG